MLFRSERRAPRPRNPYAVSKVAAEALCYQWSQTEGLDIVMARPFNHIGPGQSPRFAVSDFARQVARMRLGLEAPELTVGDIEVTRDFTDVRDVVRAYAALLDHGTRGGIYNVCSGTETSLSQVIGLLQDIAGIDLRVKVDTARLRPAEQRRMRGDASLLHTDCGWTPRIDLRQSLTDLLAHWTQEEKT